MSPTPPHSPNEDASSGQDPLDDLVATDIDDLLAEAENLASSVADEIGQPERASQPTKSDATTLTQSSSEPDTPDAGESAGADAPHDSVDDALAEMEALARHTQNEPQQQPDPAPSSERQPVEIPAATTDEADAPASTDSSSASPEPAPMATPDWDDVEIKGREDEDDNDAEALAADETDAELVAQDESVAIDASPQADEPQPTQPVDADASQAVPTWRRAAARSRACAGRIVLAPLVAVAVIAALIDVPFQWMSDSFKRILGCIAIATIIMAGVVWALVMAGYGG